MTLAEQFREECRREGREEGRREGREEGRREVWLRFLRRLLNRRFGELPAWAEARLSEGTLDDLGQWMDRIFDGSEIEDVFV